MNYKEIIDKYYESGSALRQILTLHSSQVADKALGIVQAKALDLDREMVRTAAMLHDIGIFRCDAPSIQCFGTEPYICHGVIGADLLRAEGAPEWAARVAERHTGAGLTASDITSQGLPLPHMDFLPETLLEKLICYADKFYSKSGDMKEKSFDRVRASMARHGDDTLRRFDDLHRLFS